MALIVGIAGLSGLTNMHMLVQVFFCFPINVSSTRFMIQDQMRIQNTQCDNCLIGTMLICNYLACLCSIFACIASTPLSSHFLLLLTGHA